jgi:hypothetical protein
MARETTIGMCLNIEVKPEPADNAITFDTPAVIKSVAAGAVTTLKPDPDNDPDWPTKYVVGELVFLDGTGWKSLDGKLHRIVAVVTTAASEAVTISTDTFAETAPLEAGTVGNVLGWSECVCFADWNQDAATPGEVDVTTVCDTIRVNLPGLPNLGTIAFSGPADLDDDGQVALQAAEADALPRFVMWRTRRGMIGVMHGTISSFNIVPGGVEAAMTYNASLTLDQKPYYFKATS